MPSIMQASATPTITPEVFICAGQSNAGDGNGLVAADLPSHLVSSDSGIKIWNGSAFDTLVNGSNNEVISYLRATYPQGWGPEAEFLYQYRLKYPSRTVYLVRYSAGGTTLDITPNDTVWAPNFTGPTPLFTITKNYVADALASLRTSTGLTPRVRAVLWMQGENDAVVLAYANAYQANLTAFIAAARTSWGDAATKFLIGRIANANGSRWAYASTVQAAQDAVGQADPLSPVINTDTFPLQVNNVAHYDATGQVDLGGGMWNAYTALGG